MFSVRVIFICGYWVDSLQLSSASCTTYILHYVMHSISLALYTLLFIHFYAVHNLCTWCMSYSTSHIKERMSIAPALWLIHNCSLLIFFFLFLWFLNNVHI